MSWAGEPDNNVDVVSTDIEALHASIISVIKAQFPDLKVVEFYRDDETEDMPTPACLLELEEIEHTGEDIGTEQLVARLRFAARLVFSRQNDAEAPMQIRIASAALAALINKNRFSGRISPAQLISCSGDGFRPDLTGKFVIWRIEWHHDEAMLGKNIWKNGSTDPVEAVPPPLVHGTVS